MFRSYNQTPKRRLFEVVSKGYQLNQQITFLSDGGDTVRSLQMQRRKALRSKRASRVYDNFLHLLSSNTEMALAYESLISSLHHHHRAGPLKTLLLTSSQPEEGKTTVTINLALTMMLAEKRQLLSILI